MNEKHWCEQEEQVNMSQSFFRNRKEIKSIFLQGGFNGFLCFFAIDFWKPYLIEYLPTPPIMTLFLFKPMTLASSHPRQHNFHFVSQMCSSASSAPGLHHVTSRFNKMLNWFIIFLLPGLFVLYRLAMFYIGCTILLKQEVYKMSGGFRFNFALIVVLFILLIIIGCSCFFGGY
jgi:uncharacterized protein (TIGR01732 family)